MNKSESVSKPCSLRKKKLDLQWEKKWRNMIHQKSIKEEMNKQLKATLERQKQEEEEKECTFKPQTLWNQNFRKTISFVDEFFVKLQPYIEQQQAYLNQMKELEYEDQLFALKVKEELRMMLSKALDKEIMETIIEGYKGVRTRGMNKVKREKLDILSKMIKLEREYNCFMARENVDKKDLEECGFDCDLALKLRNDILKDSLCPNSLRDFAKIRQEINQVLEEELLLSENKCLHSETANESVSNAEPDSRTSPSHGTDRISRTNRTNRTSRTNRPERPERHQSVDSSVDQYVHTKEKTPVTKRELEKRTYQHNTSTDFEAYDSQTLKYMHTNGSELDTVSRPTHQSSFHYQTYNTIPSKEFQRTFDKYNEAVNTHESHGRYRESARPEPVEPRTQLSGTEPVNTHKGIYLNNNYLKALTNEDMNKYTSTLQKDSRGLNLYIVGDEQRKGQTQQEPTPTIRPSQRKQPNEHTLHRLHAYDEMNRMSAIRTQPNLSRVSASTAYVPSATNESRSGNYLGENGLVRQSDVGTNRLVRQSDVGTNRLVRQTDVGTNRLVKQSDMGNAKLLTPTQPNLKRVGTKTVGQFQFANPIEPIRNTKEDRPFFNKLMDKIPIYNKLYR